jgi:hypothetical protein
MWEPWPLATLWASTACNRDIFTFTFYNNIFGLDGIFAVYVLQLNYSALSLTSLQNWKHMIYNKSFKDKTRNKIIFRLRTKATEFS